MTIPTSNVFNVPSKASSAADSVEFEPAYSISGKMARHLVYLVYILLMAGSATLLYVHPSQSTLILFLVLHTVLLFSLFFLVRLVLVSQNSVLVLSPSGPRWESQETVEQHNNGIQFNNQPRNSNGTIGRDYMSYAFI